MVSFRLSEALAHGKRRLIDSSETPDSMLKSS